MGKYLLLHECKYMLFVMLQMIYCLKVLFFPNVTYLIHTVFLFISRHPMVTYFLNPSLQFTAMLMTFSLPLQNLCADLNIFMR
jgi:hypothetical protein